jgi:hypothetical protein
MDAESTKAIKYSERLMRAAIDVVDAAKLQLDKWLEAEMQPRLKAGPNENLARDPKIIGLAILCRSISNFRAAILLVQQCHVTEARAPALRRHAFEAELQKPADSLGPRDFAAGGPPLNCIDRVLGHARREKRVWIFSGRRSPAFFSYHVN